MNYKDLDVRRSKAVKLNHSLIHSLIIWPIWFILGTNIVHDMTICRDPFFGQKVKGQGHTGHFKLRSQGSHGTPRMVPCKSLAWYPSAVRPSVCLSICPSVRPSVTPFWLCSHHCITMKFSGVITNDRCKVHTKGQGQRSKVKVTEVTAQLDRFRTVTPVWIHIWWWNDAYSLMLLRRGALLFFKVIRQISRSHGSKNRRIWPRFWVSGL